MELFFLIMWMMTELPNSDARNITACATNIPVTRWPCAPLSMLVRLSINGNKKTHRRF